jgi:branched-chain amino acid transport system substrate-binding protein
MRAGCAAQWIEQAMLGAESTDNALMGAWLSDRTKGNAVRTVLGRFSWEPNGLVADKPFLMTQWSGGDLWFDYPTDEFEGVAPLGLPKGKF